MSIDGIGSVPLVRQPRSGTPSSRRSALPPHLARLYGTAAWRRLRAAQLAKEPLCCDCRRENRLTAATVADHIEPARDERSFFQNALQSLCAHHHQQKTSREVNGRLGKRVIERHGCDERGMPPSWAKDHHWNRG